MTDAEYNPRTISDHALTGLRNSMRIFGDLSGFVVNQATGHIVCGHQRRKAIGEVDLSRVDYGPEYVVILGHPESRFEGREREGFVQVDEGGRFRVRLVHWPIEFEKAANLSANNTAIQGKFTEAAAALLEEVQQQTPQIAGDTMLDELLRDLHPKETQQVIEDEVPEPPAKAITAPGDLWTLGDHRLLCGDSTKAEDVTRVMGGERAGLMNTDPPYGVVYVNDERPNPGVAKPRVANDTLADEALQGFLESCFREAKAIALVPFAAWYLWHAHLTQGYFAAAAAAAAAAAVILHRQIVWIKPVLLLGRGQYHWKHEPCFMGWVKGNQPPDYGEGKGERTQTTVWEIGSVSHAERREYNHSTPKPVELFAIPIVKHLKPGELCYEPFTGTGPQFIAAEQLGRRCFGMEIEPRYCDVVVKRWETLTGKKAKREPR